MSYSTFQKSSQTFSFLPKTEKQDTSDAFFASMNWKLSNVTQVLLFLGFPTVVLDNC